jgi:hypothetical protein
MIDFGEIAKLKSRKFSFPLSIYLCLRCVPAGVEAVLWAWCATDTGPDERFWLISNVVFSVIFALILGEGNI